jgi:hypothetical protein
VPEPHRKNVVSGVKANHAGLFPTSNGRSAPPGTDRKYWKRGVAVPSP